MKKTKDLQIGDTLYIILPDDVKTVTITEIQPDSSYYKIKVKNDEESLSFDGFVEDDYTYCSVDHQLRYVVYSKDDYLKYISRQYNQEVKLAKQYLNILQMFKVWPETDVVILDKQQYDILIDKIDFLTSKIQDLTLHSVEDDSFNNFEE